MSALSARTQGAGPSARLRRHLAAAVATSTVLAVGVVGTAVPAQARPRSCANIAGSIMFFEYAMETDTGAAYAEDARLWGINVRLYYASHC